MVAADAGIEFERDAHGLEPLAQPRGQLGEPEAVLRAREGGAEAAIFALEHVDDAGEAGLREQRAIEPALRRAPGMHALDHGAVLRRHQAGRLGAGDAERMDGRVRRQPQRRRGAGGGREHADGGAGMPALADMLRPHAQADPRPDLVAGDGGAHEIAPAHAGPQLGDREQRRQGHRAHMQHAGAVHVVELEALHQGAVDQRRMRRRQPLSGAPHRAGGAWCRARRASSAGSGSRAGRCRTWRSRASPGSAA